MLPTSRSARIASFGVSCAISALYLLYGLGSNDLVIWLRGSGEVHLHGPAAWLFALSIASTFTAVGMELGVFEFASDLGTFTRRAAEVALVLVSVGVGEILLKLNGAP